MKCKISMLFFLSGLFLLLFLVPLQPATAAGRGDLISVQVQIHIEKPDYFWQYPFGGQKLDTLMVSGMGKSFTIQSPSVGDTFTFAVPKGYTLKLGITFPDNPSYNKTIYFSKKDIGTRDNVLSITLKAPDNQDVVINAPDFDEKTVQ